MAIIFSYPTVSASDLHASDRFILSQMNQTGNPTKSVTLSDLANFITTTGEGTGTTDFIVKWNDGPGGIIGDSQLQQSPQLSNGLYQMKFRNADRFIIDKPSSVTQGDPEYLIQQDGNFKVSFGWDDDGGGFGFIYNWAGNGLRLGAAGQNPQFELNTVVPKIISHTDHEFEGAILDINGLPGTAGQRLSSTVTGVEWVSDGGGTVTGTGTTNILPIWTDGPNGVLGDSVLRKIPGGGGGTNSYLFDFSLDSTVNGAFNIIQGGSIEGYRNYPGTIGYNFKTDNDGGFYKSQFSFQGHLNVDRSGNSTIPSLDVGASANAYPAAWFRNGVVVSNNPAGVTVDNTSMVIGAGNNDIVSGSDNCLAVGNNNQILADSDHSVAVGQGNTMTNADNSIVVGQQNNLTGNRLYVLGFSNDLTCASAFALGGDNNITGTQNNFAIGYNNVVSGPQKNITIGTSNVITNDSGTGYEQATIIGNSCSLTTPVSGNSTQFGMVVIGSNNAQNYPGTTSGQPFRPKIVLAADVGSGQKDALVISEGVNGIASMLHSDALLEHNFANDAAAAAGGVPVGALYHNAGDVRIRIV